MMTETEKARMNEARKQATAVFEAMGIGEALIDASGLSFEENEQSALMARMMGAPLAMMDALFAIRDGEAWRGMTDPQEIAATTLREVGVADPV